MSYEIYGLTTLHATLGDLVVYRNLEPADPRLPGLKMLWRELGWPEYRIPRKADLDYAQVLALILKRTRALDAPTARLERVLYVGDTRLLDGGAFHNLLEATGWTGYAFIARDEPNKAEQITLEGDWYLANRWHALPGFIEFVAGKGFVIDENTVAVIDLDKTFIGARGRNDKVIDAARLEGVQHTIAGLLGARFDQRAFDTAYAELNQPPYHPFTADNQDYLAYICLILGARLYPLDSLIGMIQAGRMRSFHEFIADVQRRRAEIPDDGLRTIHDDIWANVQRGDPTPFKAFRYNEYLATVARFGDLPGATAEEALAERIVITEEVRRAALVLREKGALLFGVSDKPDEASLPQPQQVAGGWQALHRLETMAVGEA